MSTGPEGDEQASPNTEGTSAPPEATAPPEPPAAPAAPPEPTVSNVIGKAFDVVGVVLFVYLALFILVIGGLALGAWIIG